MANDIIGDIHEQFDKRTALLFMLGHHKIHGAFRRLHGRKAIFVGDLADNFVPAGRLGIALCLKGG